MPVGALAWGVVEAVLALAPAAAAAPVTPTRRPAMPPPSAFTSVSTRPVFTADSFPTIFGGVV